MSLRSPLPSVLLKPGQKGVQIVAFSPAEVLSVTHFSTRTLDRRPSVLPRSQQWLDAVDAVHVLDHQNATIRERKNREVMLRNVRTIVQK